MRSTKIFLLLLFFSAGIAAFSQRDLTKYVLPIVGSLSENQLSNGNLYPCIALPFGMNHWTPQSSANTERWQYSYNSFYITGLKQTHQPSPWVGDYGVFSLMPTVGKPKFLEKERQSWFSHKAEVVQPNYYKVYLADHNTTAELAPTERGCIMNFTFPKTNEANVVIDAFDKGSFVKIRSTENKIVGFSTQHSSRKGQMPDNFKNYFVIQFNKPFKDYSAWLDTGFVGKKSEVTGQRTGVVVTFSTAAGEKIEARIASSFISQEQAELNLSREIGTKTFDQIRDAGKQVWNGYLSKISVEDNQLDDLDKVRMFYTAFYRILLYPRQFFEYNINGEIVHYSPYNGQILPGCMYTDNGFWDTFRAVHPFFNLILPEVSKNILEGLANTYKESGWLPEWASPGHINCMIGSNSTSVVASAWLNGVKDVDINVLWDAVTHSTTNANPDITSVGRAGYKEYNAKGYIPVEVINESAARTLEYAYADFCLYKLAKSLNKNDSLIRLYKERAGNYKNLFYKKYNLMAGRDSAGNFRPDFNPFAWGGDFTEGNSWHYSWSVFQDPAGLANLMGGRKNFVQMLDSVFKMPPIFDFKAYGKVIHEIREMQIMNFGQYAHGNQPIQHMIYLYNWAGEPWKTQYWSRQVMDRLYHPTPDGYCGDEDNGQTSAWYVFSALGFYPVCPVTGELALGSPLFKKLIIKLQNGKKLELSADFNSTENVYVKDIQVNGKTYTKNYFTTKELQNGGVVRFTMSPVPNKERGVQLADFPYSLSTEK